LAFIVVEEGESIESALRRFKRKVQQQARMKRDKDLEY
jgi:ribosomal protein S21